MFIWADGALIMTSIADRPYVRRIAADPRVGVCTDTKDPQRADGQRPNRQIRAIGTAHLIPDREAEWTTRITSRRP